MERKKKQKKNKIVVNNKSEVYHQHISEDLIIDILLRLPPTSVVRFKQVCKTWYALITNPDFLIRTHSSSLQFYKHTTTTTDDGEELMVSSYLSKEYRLKIPSTKHPLLKQGVFPNEVLHCYPMNSCNGLLLLRGNSYFRPYYVCNPITKHLLKIPCIKVTKKCRVWNSPPPYILFDPSTSLSYQLIRCLNGTDENGNIMSEFHVYSSETGLWRRLGSFPLRLMHDEMSVLLNGIFYWKVNVDNLLCFDLKKENVSFIPLPPMPMGYRKRKCFYFGECDGCLRLIEKYIDFETSIEDLTFPCSLDIMETEPQQQHDGNLTWSVKYHVNIETGYDHLIQYQPATFRTIRLYKTKKNEGVEEALLLNIQCKIVSFNLKNNTFGKVLPTPNSSIFTISAMCSHMLR